MARPDPFSGQVPLFGEGKVETSTLMPGLRRRVVAVAKERFARFGYEGATLAGIARAANVPFTDVLFCFGDKLTLLLAVFDAGWEAINLRFADLVITSVNAREAMLSMLVVMTRILERDPEWARLVLFESRRPRPDTGRVAISQGYRRFTELCTELAARGHKDGSFSGAHHQQIIASVLTGAVENLMRDRLLAEQEDAAGPFSEQQMAATYEALVQALKPRQFA